jgi:hypothetical protein
MPARFIRVLVAGLLSLTPVIALSEEFSCPLRFTSRDNSSISIIRFVTGIEAAMEEYDSRDVITAPPGMGLAVYFIMDVFPNYLALDARPWVAPYHNAIRWRIAIKNNTLPLQISWEPMQLPQISGGRFVLSGVAEGAVDMLMQSSASLPAGEAEIYIDYSWTAALAVEVSSLTAQWLDGAVTIAWQTEWEENNFGFDVYRADKNNGAYTQINEALIPAEAFSRSGARYTFIDRTACAGHTYYYKIMDLSRDGVQALHGPVLISSTSAVMDYQLAPNYPNPFNTSTTIEFFMPKEQEVSIHLYNVKGELVHTVNLGTQARGPHRYLYKVGEQENAPASGLYIYEVRMGARRLRKHCMIVGQQQYRY